MTSPSSVTPDGDSFINEQNDIEAKLRLSRLAIDGKSPYTVCVTCGVDISARVKAMPNASKCLDCIDEEKENLIRSVNHKTIESQYVTVNGAGDLFFEMDKRPFIKQKVRIVKICKSGLYLVELPDGRQTSLPKYNLDFESEKHET